MYNEDGVTTIDLRAHRTALLTRQPTLIARQNGLLTAPPRPRPAAVPEADVTAVHWRAPGRHRAPDLVAKPRRRPRWRRWPYSVGVDALIALVLLAVLVMAVDVLL